MAVNEHNCKWRQSFFILNLVRIVMILLLALPSCFEYPCNAFHEPKRCRLFSFHEIKNQIS